MATAASSAIVTELTRKYYHRVYCFARQLTDPHTAEDVAQEVFHRLMRIEDLDQRTISVSYLIKVAHNLIKGDHRRKRRFTAAEPDLCEVSQRRARAVERPEDVIPRIAATDLDAADAQGKLTPNERLAISLTVCQGLSLKQASESLGVRVSTVTNWKYRGLRKLGNNAPEPHAQQPKIDAALTTAAA